MKKRILNCLMALALCLTLLPTAALAEETEGTAQTPPAVEEAADPANGEAKQENQPAAPEQEKQPAEQEEQQEDPDSIYNYVKQVIRVRNQNPVIARGTTAYLEQYSGEQCFALTRSYEGSNLLLLGNTSAEAVSVDLTGLTVGGTTAEELVLLGELYTGEETAERAGTVVTLPAYSILILGEE